MAMICKRSHADHVLPVPGTSAYRCRVEKFKLITDLDDREKGCGRADMGQAGDRLRDGANGPGRSLASA